MSVWLVATYGSRLQPPDWFAEIAVNLEFVLNTDPAALIVAIDPTKIGQAATGLMAFKVRVAGYRYREDQRKPRQEREGYQTQSPSQPILFGPLWLPRPCPRRFFPGSPGRISMPWNGRVLNFGIVA